MTALAGDRNTPEKEGKMFEFPVAAATLIYAGALVCLDASGDVVPGATATTLVALGRADERVDNSAGAAGDKTVKARKGVFRFVNLGADLVTAAEIGDDCYIVDDQTVAKTDGTATRSIAGKVVDVDAQGVWVKID